ncbi:MAG: WbqC family protein [Pseudomonadota bacterium]
MTKIISIHQPAYIPWLGYFHKMSVADIFVILNTVQFEKNSFINRNRILQPDGREMWLTIPALTKADSKQQISKVLVDERVNWLDKHLRSISLCYSKSPYWDKPEHGHAMREMFRLMRVFDWKDLDANLEFSSVYLGKMLGIDSEIKKSSAYDPPLIGTKSDLVLEICQREKADIYFSGTLGKGYLEEKKFEKAGIKIAYQDYQHPAYGQHQLKTSGEFHAHMSVVDLALNHGPRSLEILTENNVGKKEMKSGKNQS